MKVKLNYFKQSGKWYSEGEYETAYTPEDGLYEVWGEIKDMFRHGKRPGLVDGKQEFNALVEVPEHPHNHLHMIMSTELGEDGWRERAEKAEKKLGEIEALPAGLALGECLLRRKEVLAVIQGQRR